MAHEPIIPRARLGFIIPSSNRNSEPDIEHFAPEGVVPHFMRLRMSGPHRVPLDELMPRIAEAASILADTKCDVITLHCTGTSMSGGFGAEREVMKTITEATGRPGLATATCLMTALKALKARKLVFISESPEEGHGKKRSFLQEAGYEIVGDKPASLAGSDEACITPPAFWADMARDTMVPGADAIFISCANILATHVIKELEAELNVPVVTSNQVVLWHALRTAGYADPIPGLGRLGTMAEAPALAAE